jgi:hypothetical protein
MSTVDLAYAVRAGDLMLRSHRLVRTDLFSFTAFGRPWLNQQWAAQLILAASARAGGWTGLAVLGAVLIALIFGFEFLACRAAGASGRVASGLALAAFALSFTGLAVRPQLLGMALFALTLWLVTGRRQYPRRVWLLPAIAAVWANVHGSFVLGPVLIALAWVEDHSDRAPGRGRLAVVGIATVAGTFVNPFGPRVWSYAWSLSRNPQITRFISEWRPPDIHHLTGGLFFGSILVVGAVLARTGRRAKWPALLTLGVFAVLGLLAVRGVFWWVLVVPPVLTSIVREGTDGGPAPEKERMGEERSILNTSLAAIFLGLAVLVPIIRWSNAGDLLHPSPALVDDAPVGLTAAVRRALAGDGRMFQSQRWGSWFELAMPEHRTFVDSRVEVFPARVWQDYSDVSQGRQGWQGILDRWQIDAMILDRNDQGGLLPLIRADPEWRLAYADPAGLVFVRSDLPLRLGASQP